MTSTGPRRAGWKTALGLNIAAAALVACLEILRACLVGPALPLPLWYGALGLLAALLLAAGWVLLAHLVRRWTGSVLPAALIVGLGGGLLKGFWITGQWVSPTGLLLAGVLGFVLVLPGPGMAAHRELLRVLVVTVLLTSGTGHPEPFGSLFLPPAVLLLVGVWGGIWWGGDVLLERVLEHRTVTVLSLGFIVAAAALAWSMTAAVPRWGNPAPYRGEPGNVRKVGRDALPNIILISLDTLRWDMVPGRDSERTRLSALGRLRRDSVRFPETFSTSSWTLPSHASLFTGRLPTQHGAVEFPSKAPGSAHTIRSDVPLYTQFLNRLGYATAGFTGGKLVGKRHGFARGFDRYWEHPGPEGRDRYEGFVPEGIRLAALLLRGTRYAFHPRTPSEVFAEEAEGSPRYFRQHLERARSWLRDRERRGESRPFFLFLHTYQIHDWHHVHPESFRALHDRRPDLAGALLELADQDDLPRSKAGWRRLRNAIRHLPLAQWPRIQLLERLDLRDPAERIRVFTSDPEPYVQRVLANRSDTVWEDFRKPPADLPASARRRFRTVLSKLQDRKDLRLGALVRRMTPAERRNIKYSLASLGTRRIERALNGPPGFLRSTLSTFDTEPFRTMDTLSRRQWRALKALYRHDIRSTDRALAEFLAFLQRRGLYDPSLIVLLSDHGEGFVVDHGAMHHGKNQMDEVLMRVPLWIKLPGGRRAASTYEGRLQITDVFPILLEHLGVSGPPMPPRAPAGALDAAGKKKPVSGRTFVRGSVKTNPDFMPPRYYLRGPSFKVIFEGEGRPRYWSVREGSLEETPARPQEIPATARNRLKTAHDRFIEVLRRHPNPYERPAVGSDPRIPDALKGLPYLR